MKTLHWTVAALLASCLLAACGKEETPKTVANEAATKSADAAVSNVDAAKAAEAAAVKNADAAKANDATAAKTADEAAKTAADAAKAADSAKTAADAASNSLVEQAKPLLEQATAYITDNKVELADKVVTQLEGMKDKLPTDWAAKVDQARKALDALKATENVKKGLGSLKIGG